MKTLFITLFLIFIFQLGYAQDSLKTVKKIRINDIGGQINLYTGGGNYTELADFKKLAPQSAFLRNYLVRFMPKYNNTFSDITSTPVLSVFVGFKFLNKQKNEYNKHIRLKTGLTLFNQHVLGYLSYQEIKTADILSSNSSGNTLVIDSVISRSNYMTYSSNQLRADISLLWTTNQEKHRMAFYIGLGVSAGLSVKSKTTISYNTYSRIKYNGQEVQATNSSNNSGTSSFETFKNKSDYGMAVYIPLGIDLVLGKKRKIAKNTHLYYEIKPCYNTLIVTGVNDYAFIGILHGWGLRFTL